MYLPECYSSTDEFAYILEPVGRYHRVITTHIRGEGDSMVQSVREVIEIARRVAAPGDQPLQELRHEELG